MNSKSSTEKQLRQYKYLNFGTIVTVVGFIINMAMWKQNVDDRLINVEAHANSKEVHMPFKEKIRIFSTKEDVVELRKSVDKLNNKIDKLIDYKLRNR